MKASTVTTGKTMTGQCADGGLPIIRPAAAMMRPMAAGDPFRTTWTARGTSVSSEYIHAIGSAATISQTVGQNMSRVIIAAKIVRTAKTTTTTSTDTHNFYPT